MQKLVNIGILDSSILEGLDHLIKYMPDLGAEIYVNAKKNSDGKILGVKKNNR